MHRNLGHPAAQEDHTMTRTISRRLIPTLLISLSLLAMSCDGVLSFLGSGVKIVIINDTDYTAIPDLRTSDSQNIFEDILNSGEQYTSFGTNGSIAPHQTVTFYLTCDGDLELIAFGGADFQGTGNLSVGDADASVKLRRDTHFDCGDTVTIRLEGSVFNFTAEVDVTEASNNDDDDGEDSNSTSNEIADFLEDLFD